MEKIFILGNSDYLRQLGYPCIDIPNLVNDNEIHIWIANLFKNKDIEKLVIEIDGKSNLALLLGFHIRLTLEELRNKAFIPILFVSLNPLNTIIIKNGIYSHLLSTKGVYFSVFEDINSLKNEIEVIEGIATNEYKTGFLDIIHILPDENIGRHSLANIWGAYSMDKAANTNALPQDADFKKKLYFKYIAAHIFDMNLLPLKIVGKINTGKPKTIDAAGKKILLIDDEANKGWESVLRKVFKTSCPEDFVVINETVNNYDNFTESQKQIIEKGDFDLYLIDLRLNGTAEEDNLKTEDFSGTKVLEKIKSLNKGNQVIIFTASNKVWNLKALLDAGADGYYMKESPEYSFSKEFSEQNYKRFEEDVKRCLKRDYLKKIYSLIQKKIKPKIYSLADEQYKDFKQELQRQIDLFWNMISKARTKTDFAYSYVTLYMIIEMINKQFITEINGECFWNETIQNYDFKPIEKLTEWSKLAFLYFKKWQQTDNQFIRNIYFLITKRNGFVHNDKNILDSQNGQGHFLNRDIYTKEGIINLFTTINKVISFL